MLVHIKIFLARLREGLWFLPTNISLLAFAAALFLIHLDLQHINKENYIFGIGFTDAVGARNILTSIASASITVAGVVFSITMAVLANASSQYGPRLLRNFLAERSTKIVLGLFIGTFAYCITVALTINAEKSAIWIPLYSVVGGCIFGLTSFAALIYFIHRVATFIQASTIIEDVVITLESHSSQLFPNNAIHRSSPNPPTTAQPFSPAKFDSKSFQVTTPSNGYVQALELDGILDYAVNEKLLVRFLTRPGKPVLPGQIIADFWLDNTQQASPEFIEKSQSRILSSIITGSARTPDQDIEFAIDQLVEIAVRALSPGINDPFTAINCINRLVGSLALIGIQELPAGLIHDDTGNLHIVVPAYTQNGICDAAFHRLRHHGKLETSVALALLDAMLRLGKLEGLASDFRSALERHIRLLCDDFYALENIHHSDTGDFKRRLTAAGFPLTN